jgi:hypothetical protein
LRGLGKWVYQKVIPKDPNYCAKTKKTCSLKKETALPKEGGLTHIL